MKAGWDTRMVELLIHARRAGEHDFGRAWRWALEVARREGLGRPQDFRGESQARREGDEGWLPWSSFFRRACQREWNGQVKADYLGLPELLNDSGLSTSSDAGAETQNSRVQLIA
jgi:hypothetical protein